MEKFKWIDHSRPITLYVRREFIPLIRDEVKTIDVRASTPIVREIRVGDRLQFNDNPDCERYVARIGEYETLEVLVETEDVSKIDPTRTPEELLALGKQLLASGLGYRAFELSRTKPEAV